MSYTSDWVPDWRFRRIFRLYNGCEPPEQNKDDKFTIQYYRYYKHHMDTMKSDVIFCNSIKKYPAQYFAYQLQRDPKSLIFVMPQILCGRSVSDIAKFMGISEDAVLYYEKIFFDVRDKLASPGCIFSELIDINLDEWTVPVCYNHRLMYIAYTEGWEALKKEWKIDKVEQVQQSG